MLQNLVFNRLGNSFSAMVEYEDRTAQIWDDVKFSDGFILEITGICTEENGIFSVQFSVNRQTFKVFFNSSGFGIEDYSFSVGDEYFYLETDNPELLFKLSMTDFEYISVEKGNEKLTVKIPEKNFFKALGEFVLTVKYS